jgi:hypothetical protein
MAMLRSLPIISIICAVIYFQLPMRRVPDAELERVYNVWRETAAQEDVVVLRELFARTKANADRLRSGANMLNFSAKQKEAGQETDANGNIGEWSNDQLVSFFGPILGGELFSSRVGNVSSVRSTKDGGGAFYLTVARRKRTLPAFLKIKSTIEAGYNTFRSARRWSSLSPPIPSREDYVRWYGAALSETH